LIREARRDYTFGKCSLYNLKRQGHFFVFLFWKVSGIHGNSVFRVAFGNLILSFPKGQYKEPVFCYFRSMGPMKEMVKSYFIFFPWSNIKYLFTKHKTKLSIIHHKPFMERNDA
jgi:hypothetical protein